MFGLEYTVSMFGHNFMTSKYINTPTSISNNAENISISFLNFESSVIIVEVILKIKKQEWNNYYTQAKRNTIQKRC